ncbi:hypothetical protein HPB50_013837 [Hyalomma asiaticum]|uniref:Uncharacterized protein n=1 Tax=Hyalomma asiaticum TaxID=266040 RepID=A0ACB7SQC5_HYAAI|nr:hypothetical protein HPB50_013837 [Hyalomma asiaticum]
MKACDASWTHRDWVSHFSEYIEGEAFKWYLTDIFSNVETWDDIKRDMQNRFATTDGDAFRIFIHYRLKGGQTIKEYYEEKKRLGSLADLKECHIISRLTDGVPSDVELALAGLSFKTSTWGTMSSLSSESESWSLSSMESDDAAQVGVASIADVLNYFQFDPAQSSESDDDENSEENGEGGNQRIGHAEWCLQRAVRLAITLATSLLSR